MADVHQIPQPPSNDTRMRPVAVTLEINTSSSKQSATETPGGEAWFGPIFLGLQVLMITLYGAFTKYDPTVTAADTANPNAGEAHVTQIYGFFQDVHVMIFIGFGFLMTFMRKYGFGAISFNMMLAAFAIQWSILVHGFMHKLFSDELGDEKITLNLVTLVEGDFAAATILISFGAIIGKCSPSQYLFMVIVEIVLYAINFEIGVYELEAVDVGGTMFIHTFGAYFGLAVSLMISPGRAKGHKANSSRYTSDIFSMVGTVFLWVYWPSFVGVLAGGNARVRIIIHTLFAICSSCMGAMAMSSILRHKRRFDMVDVQNATLAGGVAIGAVADFTIGAHGAMIIGLVAGCISTVGYASVEGFLEHTIGLQDTCGVHNLHGMPGVIGGLASALGVLATVDYGDNLDYILKDGRSRGQQAGYQLAALVITLLIAVVGGLGTGFLMRYIPQPVYLFNDQQYFSVPDDFYDQDKDLSDSPLKKKRNKAFKRRQSVAQRGVQFSTTSSPRLKH